MLLRPSSIRLSYLTEFALCTHHSVAPTRAFHCLLALSPSSSSRRSHRRHQGTLPRCVTAASLAFFPLPAHLQAGSSRKHGGAVEAAWASGRGEWWDDARPGLALLTTALAQPPGRTSATDRAVSEWRCGSRRSVAARRGAWPWRIMAEWRAGGGGCRAGGAAAAATWEGGGRRVGVQRRREQQHQQRRLSEGKREARQQQQIQGREEGGGLECGEGGHQQRLLSEGKQEARQQQLHGREEGGGLECGGGGSSSTSSAFFHKGGGWRRVGVRRRREQQLSPTAPAFTRDSALCAVRALRA
ncbi:unnamed protein product [Closterium sp. Naga37s-1]|nr:unnamed protein product [Closterium sp. Naga37s-1]